jgi:hypothetical protein
MNTAPAMTTFLEPDRDQLEMFINALFRHAGSRGYVSLRAFYEDETKPFRISPVPLTGGLPFVIERAFDDAHRAANDPKRVVFCPPIAIFENGKRAREKDILAGLALSVECDQHPQRARERLVKLLGEPTLVVRSGGLWTDPATGEIQDKLHLHWRLAQPATRHTLADLKIARDLATGLVGGDPTNKPVCHCIRMAGSWHRKKEPRLCEIIEQDPDREIELAEALAALRAVVPEEKAKTNGAGGSTNGSGEPDHDWPQLIANIQAGKDLHDSIATLAFKLLCAGMNDGAAVRHLRALMENSRVKHDEPERWKARFADIPRAVSSAREKHRAEQVVAATAAATRLWDPWQEQVAPPFPLDALAQTIQHRVRDRTETIGVDPAAVAMSTFTSISAVSDHRITLKPKQHDEYRVRTNLWILLVGPPSTRKTSAIKDAEYHPRALDRADAARYADAVRRIKEEAKAAGEKPDLDGIPPPRVRVIKNSTSEALVELLADQDCGTTLFTDEMAGWIGTMDKYVGGKKGADAERAVWLLAHGGGPYSQRRVGAKRATNNLGTIQPDRLKELGRLATDGLLQRFLPAILRDAVAGKDLLKPCTRDYTDMLNRIGALGAPRTFLLDHLARAIYFRMEDDAVAVGKANDPFGSFYAKQPRTLLVLALLLHLCELVEGRVEPTDPVSEETMTRADRILRSFILPQAKLFYEADPRHAQDTQQIAAAILKHPDPSIKLRDLTRGPKALRGLEPLDVQKKLFTFVAEDWLIPAATHPGNTLWTINPAIRGQFDKQLEAHLAAEQQIRDSILAAGRRRRHRSNDD